MLNNYRNSEEQEQYWTERRTDIIKRPNEERSDFERDRARIIHSATFRRLQAKTQVLGITEGDFHRTRLTHSMEVAQIGRGIVNTLNKTGSKDSYSLPSIELIEAICFAHDLGHPPFGHGGEIALNYAMRDYGGFEGNGQTLRILSNLESHTKGYGLNLTRRTLMGVLKYPVLFSNVYRKTPPQPIASNSQLKSKEWKPPKCYLDIEKDLVEWILNPLSDKDRKRFVQYSEPTNDEHGKAQYKSLDASIMELADDIAYGVHDLEDGIALGLITQDHWQEASTDIDSTWENNYQLNNIVNDLFDKSEDAGHKRKQAISSLVNSFINSVEIKKDKEFQCHLLSKNACFKSEAKAFLDALKKLTKKYIIDLQTVQTLEYRGRYIVLSLFEAINSDPEHLLSKSFLGLYNQCKNKCEDEKVKARKRVICDYISGMTDEYATRMYERLFIPRHGTVFQKL